MAALNFSSRERSSASNSPRASVPRKRVGPSLRGECPHVAADHDVDTLHRDAAPRSGIAFDDEQTAVRGRSGGL